LVSGFIMLDIYIFTLAVGGGTFDVEDSKCINGFLNYVSC